MRILFYTLIAVPLIMGVIALVSVVWFFGGAAVALLRDGRYSEAIVGVLLLALMVYLAGREDDKR